MRKVFLSLAVLVFAFFGTVAAEETEARFGERPDVLELGSGTAVRLAWVAVPHSVWAYRRGTVLATSFLAIHHNIVDCWVLEEPSDEIPVARCFVGSRPKEDVALALIRRGVLFPTPDAPRFYHRAALDAARERLGVWGVADW